MKCQRLLHAVILQQGLSPRHFLQNFARQILTFEQHAKLHFFERRIIQQRQHHVHVGMVQQSCKLLAGRNECALPIFVSLCHFNALPHSRPLRLHLSHSQRTGAATRDAPPLPPVKLAAILFPPGKTSSSTGRRSDSPGISTVRSSRRFLPEEMACRATAIAPQDFPRGKLDRSPPRAMFLSRNSWLPFRLKSQKTSRANQPPSPQQKTIAETLRQKQPARALLPRTSLHNPVRAATAAPAANPHPCGHFHASPLKPLAARCRKRCLHPRSANRIRPPAPFRPPRSARLQ